MPPTVHKILIHGSIIVKNAMVPIGELSEEAQESKNKDIRRYRESFTRKFNALKVNEDLFHRLLLSSDPYISSYSTKNYKKTKVENELRDLLVIDEQDNEEKEQLVNEEFSDSESD